MEPLSGAFPQQEVFVVATQLASGLLFGLAALALHLPAFFAVTVALFAVVAFSGATHDIAADGVYMSELSTSDQAKYIGWQGAFYNLAKLVATGGLVWLAGWLMEYFAAADSAGIAASRSAWSVIFLVLAGLMLAAGFWHMRALPLGGAAASQSHTVGEGLAGLREVIVSFFAKRHIWVYIAFIILYRLGEGFVMKIVPLFLKADTAAGGLGLTNQQIGLYYGTFGAGAFLLGSLLAGITSRAGVCAARSSRWCASSTSRSRSTPCWRGSSPRTCGSSAEASSWSTSATDSDSWASRSS